MMNDEWWINNYNIIPYDPISFCENKYVLYGNNFLKHLPIVTSEILHAFDIFFFVIVSRNFGITCVTRKMHPLATDGGVY